MSKYEEAYNDTVAREAEFDILLDKILGELVSGRAKIVELEIENAALRLKLEKLVEIALSDVPR